MEILDMFCKNKFFSVSRAHFQGIVRSRVTILISFLICLLLNSININFSKVKKVAKLVQKKRKKNCSVLNEQISD